MSIWWLFTHLFSVLGFVLAFIVLAGLPRERRTPSSTFAWLLAIALIPYVGVPLYLMFGARKMKGRLASGKALKQALYLPSTKSLPADSGRALERILCSAGAPRTVGGNALELYPTGEDAFAALAKMIGRAERSIHIETFILGGDEVGNAILDLLERRAGDGLEIRLLIDAIFAFRADRGRLEQMRRAGAKYAFFMPMLHIPFRGQANLRNHRKIWIADGKEAIVGGMNIAREYMGPTPYEKRWRDVAIGIAGPAAIDLDRVFRSDWAFASNETLGEDEPTRLSAEQVRLPRGWGPNPSGPTRLSAEQVRLPRGWGPNPSGPTRLSAEQVRLPSIPAGKVGRAEVQVVASGPDVPGDTLYDALLSALFSARSRIWIATPYFIPDEALTRALVLAVRRGVDVRIVVPLRSNHWTADVAGGSYLRQVKDAGALVQLYVGGMMHAKAAVVDDTVAILGSANLDIRSLFLDYEVALFFYSVEEIALLAGWFDTLFKGCVEKLREPTRSRMLLENVGRLLAPLV